ncbi:MAG: hypothetical protein NZ959_10315 [Armatimonadetes bacterium]|nr:hypothetical protein [Armatimonadota bacterium]MDW8122482.1 hypothetical protein [Armatimonadota bacterium]
MTENAFEPQYPDVLVVFCSDGRFAGRCRQFVERELGISRYDQFIVPGGPAWLILRSETFTEYDVAKEAVTFLIEAHQIKKVILIAHEDCGFYRHRIFYNDPKDLIATQKRDLKEAGQVLRAWFPELEVRSFYATVRQGTIQLESVKESKESIEG